MWHLGYADQSLKYVNEGRVLSRQVLHPLTLLVFECDAGWLYHLCGLRQAAGEIVEHVIALSAEHGNPFFIAWGHVLQGAALAEQGKGAEGVALIRRGIDAFRDSGAVLMVPWFLGWLASALGDAGKTEGGLTTLAEAMDLVSKNGDRHFEAELYRIKGKLLFKSLAQNQLPAIGDIALEAASCFSSAIEVAQRQQAKFFELRASMGLARLWQQQGKIAEALKMLAKIYGWFTEGFDTADLKEAKALLDELESESSLKPIR